MVGRLKPLISMPKEGTTPWRIWGLNFPYIAYRDIIGDPLDPYYIDKDTKIFFRYFQEDILAIKGYLKTGQLGLGEVILSLFNKKAPAIWSFSDPMPGIYYFMDVIKKVFRKIFKR